MIDHSISKENLDIYFGGGQKSSLALDDNRRNIIVRWLKSYAFNKNGKVLDIGCWNGDFLKLLPETWEKTGMDLVRHKSLPVNVGFIPGSAAERLPFSEGSYDLVFAGEIIEHLLDTSKFLLECQRVLKTWGLLLLTTPNLSCWLNLKQWFSLDQPWCVDSDSEQNGHVRYLAPKVLMRMLIDTGFQVLEMSTVGGLERFKDWPHLYACLFSLFPMRGKYLMCLAQKIHA